MRMSHETDVGECGECWTAIDLCVLQNEHLGRSVIIRVLGRRAFPRARAPASTSKKLGIIECMDSLKARKTLVVGEVFTTLTPRVEIIRA